MKLTEQQINLIMQGREYLPLDGSTLTMGQLLDALQTNYSELFSSTAHVATSTISLRLWMLALKMVAATATDEDLLEMYRLLYIWTLETGNGG